MNRKQLFDSVGATRNTDFSWSAVNHDEAEVYFGAWTNELESEEGGRRIFSTDWERNEQTGRRNNSYGESYRNINLVLANGYRLFTFPMWRRPNTDKIQISHIEDTLEECFLVCKGNDYFSVGVGASYTESAETEKTVAQRWEGSSYQVLLTGYERNLDARSDCLREHGHQCVACKFDFEEQFGDIGKGFIHVHHLTRMADRPKPYVIDGKSELVPVCPNCHAMIHRRIPPFTIEEIVSKRKLARNSQ